MTGGSLLVAPDEILPVRRDRDESAASAKIDLQSTDPHTNELRLTPGYVHASGALSREDAFDDLRDPAEAASHGDWPVRSPGPARKNAIAPNSVPSGRMVRSTRSMCRSLRRISAGLRKSAKGRWTGSAVRPRGIWMRVGANGAAGAGMGRGRHDEYAADPEQPAPLDAARRRPGWPVASSQDAQADKTTEH